MIDINTLTIQEALSHLRSGDFKARELVQAYLDQISKTNEGINAYLEVYNDALLQADEVDKNGYEAPLSGIPIAVKDNMLIKGKHFSAGSKILEGYVSPYNATVIEKLKKAGAVFIGRTNMDEFAMGSSTENSAFGVTKNPLDLSRVPGGSSGGSSAAVAMNSTLAALGSDTGGSIREPASFCGVVGLKPTYGSVSRHGLIAMGSSLDVIGPITKTVTDSEIVFNVIRGKDNFDSTSHDQIEKNKKSPKIIGVPYHVLDQGGISENVLSNFKQAVEKLKTLGYEVRDVKLPNIGYSLAVYYVLMPAEVSSNLARFDGVKYGLHIDGKDLLDDYLKTRGQGFGKEVRRRILIGTYVLSAGYHDAYYNKAIMLRQKIAEEFDRVFAEVDVIVMPTTPGPAFKIGERVNDPLAMYLEDIFTVPANIVGIPAISIPSGFVEEDGVSLPLGLQIIAPHDCERMLFEVGKKFNNE
jgi:aspartyl-tRNA(Asn)/glutamyl-tRNA(Gln) amidotransferase subunit A